MLLLTSWWRQLKLCLPSLCVQIYSNRELEDQLTKIREMLSDDKHDWEHRVVAVRVLSNTHKKIIDVGGRARRWDTDGALLSLIGSSAAEESSVSHAGRGGGLRGLPSAAAPPGGSLQTVGQRPAIAGGPGGLHHAGVRAHGHVVIIWYHSDASRCPNSFIYFTCSQRAHMI